MSGDHVIVNWIVNELGMELLTPRTVLQLRTQDLLSDEEVISIELARMMSGLALSPAEERVALLLSDESHEVVPLLEGAVGLDDLTDGERETVLIVRLLAIRRSWDSLVEPGFYVESEIDDWDRTNAYESIRFSTPPPPGQRGVEGYLARLDALVEHRIGLLRDPR